MIQLRNLLNEETFTATNKKSGKTSVFKSKDSRDAAIKAGTHDAKKDTSSDKGKSSKGKETPKVNIFNKPSETPKSSTISPASLGVDKVVYNTRTKNVGIVRLADERGETKTDADGNVNTSELEPYNPTKYPHQKDAKVAPSTQKEVDSRGLWNPFSTDNDEPKSNPRVDSIVSRIQKAYDSSTDKKKDIEGLKSQLQTWKEFGANDKKDQIEAGEKFLKSIEAQTKPEPRERKGVPAVNKAVRQQAQKLGITPEKLGKDEYLKKMAQAAVSALTDSNFHPEARQLVADLEGKPEMAEKPEYPSMKDPKYKEKMAVLNAKYDSVYSSPDKDADELGTSASQSAEWSGDTAIDAIAFDLRMNGFHKMADKIQSVIKEGKVNRTSLTRIMNESASKEAVGISVFTGTRADAVDAFIQKHNLDAMKLYKSIKSANLQGRMNFVTALVGKDGNPQQRLTIKLHKK